MRETEGAHLRDEVLSHLAELERLAAEIEERWLPTRDAAFAAMRARVSEALEKMGEKLEESRYMQEIVLLTDKWDVSEELARLKSHAAKFRSTGEDRESTGRKLDFIVQEMNREVNTLDSKVADADIRWLAVDAKACPSASASRYRTLNKMPYKLVHVGFGNMVVAGTGGLHNQPRFRPDTPPQGRGA